MPGGRAMGGSRVLILRGRKFTAEDLRLIARLAEKYRNFGRTRISVEICKTLQWTQPNGWLKDRACRDVLNRLHKRRLIKLPRHKKRRARQYSLWKPVTPATDIAAEEIITNIAIPISLKLAKGGALERQWNQIVQEYHYLGHKVSVGKSLKFLVRSGEVVLGAISLAESAWSVSARDRLLATMNILREEVSNNTRFVILPHVRVKCLASRILSLLATVATKHWETYYSIKLKCLESFVDDSKFKGTAYKAANWIQIGKTQGYRKAGAQHFNSQSVKSIYVYPLDAKVREAMRNTEDALDE